ncbi:uncharacterized protein LOC132603225 [Lycium barbarum]|uniref:uncharacterized protein LOC132603225 n=1 Tax=Lycium barbarum TaxID=112863 RepID=UPI00293E9E02|nr:uncharacterized protein LOC132603225 [Lycium barbarum]
MTNEEMSDIEMIRKKVVDEWGVMPYFHQPFNLDESPDWRYPLKLIPESGHLQMLQRFLDTCDQFKSFDFSIKPMKAGGVKLCSYSELQQITDFKRFSLETLSGRLFRGTIREGYEERPVVVKTCDLLLPYRDGHFERLPKFCDEIELFMDEKANTHKNLAKLYAFCCDKRLAVVYDENVTCRLSDVFLNDDFGWDLRINVATQLADLLSWLHEKRIAVGSIIASCIMIDEEVNIKVFDFGFVSNHVNEDSKIPVEFFIGREAPEAIKGKRTMKSDVYIFALLLLELVTKKEYEYKINYLVERGEKKLVDESFKTVDDATAWEITKLISKCMVYDPNERPTMKEVFDALKAMRARGEKRKRAESEAE